ncbi:MAG: Acetolactate synthase large subunit IlvX [Syntrophus sp. SKADARSKE-3]|nr:Acetolactate synthase large subunit IlvX [Syntrophus sp. SKADARSKE-3]
MTGADILLKTAVAAGVEICFANAGTTELPFVAAMDNMTGIRPVLGLFEGVCTGAADGYGRMLEKPAMNLLHLGPGLANGIANLHNARRARTPILNVVGQHASWHVAADAPLTMDIEALAGTVSGWQQTIRSPGDIATDTTDALIAARYGQIATLIAPCDHLWEAAPDRIIHFPPHEPDAVDPGLIEKGIRLLQNGGKTAVIIGGRALRHRGLKAAALLKAAFGCDLLSVTFPAYVERGAGLTPLARIPYFPQMAVAMLAPYDAVVLVGTDDPVAFFGYKGGKSGFLGENQQRVRIDTNHQDGAAVLEALADAAEVKAVPDSSASTVFAPLNIPDLPSGALDADKMCRTIAALQPENAVIVEEGIMSGFTYHSLSANLHPHSVLFLPSRAAPSARECPAPWVQPLPAPIGPSSTSRQTEAPCIRSRFSGLRPRRGQT